MIEPTHPGELIREELDERGWSQADLARRSGLTQKHISMVVNAHSGLGTEAAQAIGDAMGINPTVLLRLQVDWDLHYGRTRSRR